MVGVGTVCVPTPPPWGPKKQQQQQQQQQQHNNNNNSNVMLTVLRAHPSPQSSITSDLSLPSSCAPQPPPGPQPRTLPHTRRNSSYIREPGLRKGPSFTEYLDRGFKIRVSQATLQNSAILPTCGVAALIVPLPPSSSSSSSSSKEETFDQLVDRVRAFSRVHAGGVVILVGCQPRPLARKLWERQGQFRKSQAVLEPFVAVLANSRKSVSCYCMGWINLNL
ncbi:hypothetical protein O3P69_012469 [Scylla paramamosain]|uniref:Uncharacterized protein n=1 Tax=Scylla paramamosain TaxID=85552 RepID=A0AAW0SE54_SCYPA